MILLNSAFTYEGTLADSARCTEYSLLLIKQLLGRVYSFPKIVCFYHNSPLDNQPTGNIMKLQNKNSFVDNNKLTLLFPIMDKPDLVAKLVKSPNRDLFTEFSLPDLRVASYPINNYDNDI